jgi:hypothetical protein
MEKTGEAYETPDQQGALKLQYFLLATEMSRLVDDPRSPLKGDETGQQLHLQDENDFLKNNYVNLKQRIDDLSNMAMDYMLTPRGEELNYASNLTGDLSKRSYASKQKPSVVELLQLNKVIAGKFS